MPDLELLTFGLVLPDGFRERDIARLEIQSRLFRGTEDVRAVVVEFTFPSRDDDCRQAVADQVHAGPTHGTK